MLMIPATRCAAALRKTKKKREREKKDGDRQRIINRLERKIMRYKTENETMSNGGKQSRVSQILQFFKESTPKKQKNKWNAKRKLHRRWRIRTPKGQQQQEENKIGCEEEEQQQQEETAANRYPPVIIPGIISIRHSLRVFYQINAHMKALQMNSISLPNTIIKHMHEHIKFTWNTLEITYPT
jgi:hypothetical protein